MITVKRIYTTYEEITEEDFAKWLKEVYKNAGNDLDGLGAIRFYLDEEWRGTNYGNRWGFDTDVEVLGLTDEKALAMIKKVAQENEELNKKA